MIPQNTEHQSSMVQQDMRIVCLYFPGFALQSLRRERVAGLTRKHCLNFSNPSKKYQPSCQRALATVRDLLPQTSHKTASFEVSWQQGDVYLLFPLPKHQRGQRFASQVIARAERLDFSATCGIADDRFTATVAARLAGFDPNAGHSMPASKSITVPRGGGARFLRPLSTSFLPTDDVTKEVLQTCGVATLGEFAALPKPTVPLSNNGRAWLEKFLGLQKMASGDDDTKLTGDKLSPPGLLSTQNKDEALAPRDYRENLPELAAPGLHQGTTHVTTIEEIAYGPLPCNEALDILSERIAMRLQLRNQVGSRFSFYCKTMAGKRLETVCEITNGASSRDQIYEEIQRNLPEIIDEKLHRATLVVEHRDSSIVQLDLFDSSDAVDAVDAAIRRLESKMETHTRSRIESTGV